MGETFVPKGTLESVVAGRDIPSDLVQPAGQPAAGDERELEFAEGAEGLQRAADPFARGVGDRPIAQALVIVEVGRMIDAVVGADIDRPRAGGQFQGGVGGPGGGVDRLVVVQRDEASGPAIVDQGMLVEGRRGGVNLGVPEGIVLAGVDQGLPASQASHPRQAAVAGQRPGCTGRRP